MNGYVLKGSEGDFILVIRTVDEDVIRHIANKLATAGRDMKQLAESIEVSLNNSNRRNTGKARPKNATKSRRRSVRRTRKTRNS